jgi:hypothetical protein
MGGVVGDGRIDMGTIHLTNWSLLFSLQALSLQAFHLKFEETNKHCVLSLSLLSFLQKSVLPAINPAWEPSPTRRQSGVS